MVRLGAGMVRDGGASILTGESLREYFRDMLASALAHQNVQVAQTTEFYLVNLLAEFLDTKNLFHDDPAGAGLSDEPLAFMLKRAQEEHGFERIRALKHLGDTSLYISGFWGDSLDGKLVDIDYYVAMGGRAYSALSEAFGGDALAALYEEMSGKFLRLVDLLSEVSERAAVGTNRGLVRLYERYIKTGSERIARLLAERGVLPAKVRDPGFVQ